MNTKLIRLLHKIVFFSFFVFLWVMCEPYEEVKLKDSKDHQAYPIVQIGDQRWMAKNYNYYDSNGVFFYEKKRSNRDKYGCLYSYSTATADVPEGWKIPSKEDWQTLFNELTSSNNDLFDKIMDDNLGLRIKFGGFGYNNGSGFLGEGETTFFWTSTVINNRRVILEINQKEKTVGFGYLTIDMQLSLRFVKE